MTAGEVSLYFGLEKGQRADLEVIAAAAIEWAASLRAAAREIDPEAEIRVEIIDANESSIRLNATLEWIERAIGRVDKGAGKYPNIKRLAIALAIFIPTVGVPTYDFYFGEKAFTNEDRKMLREILEKVKQNPEVGSHRQQFFKTVERDRAIVSAGVSSGHKEKPLILVPRDQFAERSGVWKILGEDPLDRKTYPVVDVVLISPVLLPIPKPWKFQPQGLPEFTAKMVDKRFLAALEQDHIKESLRSGIPMTLRLEVKEQKIGDTWVQVPRGRSVVEVISPKVD